MRVKRGNGTGKLDDSEGSHFASMAGSRRGELTLLTVDTIRTGQMGVTFYYAGKRYGWQNLFHLPVLMCTLIVE
ncbi:hypothetical protein [Paenibacillus sp. FSL K6-2859]|uniref:hypothetical protein n=1 Tax=Paenibacillus sp. FSL K6-2859 TaxID=2921482 RepID=UPI0030FA5509